MHISKADAKPNKDGNPHLFYHLLSVSIGVHRWPPMEKQFVHLCPETAQFSKQLW